MDLVVVLHSHIPYVLRHGRWPHGTDWLCEAVLDSYLPLLAALRALPGPDPGPALTFGVTPVLAAQLADPAFPGIFDAFLTQRLNACDEAPASLRQAGHPELIPLIGFWQRRFGAMRRLFRSIDGDLTGALAALEAAGRIELMSSAATHAFLPLLAREESVTLQLTAGQAEHRRLFRTAPRGCWLPECGYRAAGDWAPVPGQRVRPGRPGLEEPLAAAGYRFFVTEAHLAGAGPAPTEYGGEAAAPPPADAPRSPYRTYQLPVRHDAGLTVLVRDPQTAHQVWSRHAGYPGDADYLEFHRIHWPGGLRFWRVSPPGTPLDAKQPYDPARASRTAADHAAHFAALVRSAAALPDAAILVAPFDTELFGHWWFEGPAFLQAVLASAGHGVEAVTASRAIARTRAAGVITLEPGSWGAGGDDSMWLNQRTAWIWPRLWSLEDALWDAAPGAMEEPSLHPVLEQAARELMLAQASDWPFLITGGEVADYAERRLLEHCAAAERLTGVLQGREPVDAGQRAAEEFRRKSPVFPGLLDSIAGLLRGHPGAISFPAV